MNEDDIGEPLEVLPEELTNEEWLDLGQESIAEEESTEWQTTWEEKEEEPLKIIPSEMLVESFADLNKLLKIFENMDFQHWKVWMNRVGLFLVHYLLTSKAMIKKETEPTPINIFLKRVTQEEPQQVLQEVSQKKTLLPSEMTSLRMLLPQKTSSGAKVEV